MSPSGCRGPKKGKEEEYFQQENIKQQAGKRLSFVLAQSQVLRTSVRRVAPVKLVGKPVQGKSEAGSKLEPFI